MIDLKKVLDSYPNAITDRNRFKAILTDLYPTEKRDINLLTIALELGIIDEVKGGKVTSFDVDIFQSQFYDNYGVSPDIASCVIDEIMQSFGYTMPSANGKRHYTSPTSHPSPIKHAPIVNNPNVQAYVGNPDEFLVEQGTTGHFYISKYRGFVRDEIVIPNEIEGKTISGIGFEAFKGLRQVKRVVVSDGIKYIEKAAFEECEDLEEVILPDSIEHLGFEKASMKKGVFERCANLKIINLPNGLNEIGARTFFCCSKLISIVLPDSVKFVGEYAFDGCVNLSSVMLNSQLKAIGEGAFKGCKELKEVNIPNDVTVLEKHTFTSCVSLQQVYLPDNLKKIEEGVFWDCHSLTDVQFPRTLEWISDKVFMHCDLEKIILNEGCTRLGAAFVYGCERLKSIYVPNSVEYFAGNAFDGVQNKITIFCHVGAPAINYAYEHNIVVQDVANMSLS